MPCSEQVLRASWHHEIPLELTGSRVSATAGACKAMVRDAGTDRPPASSSCEVPAPPLGRGLVRRFGVWFCSRSGSSQQLREHLWQMAPMGCSLPAQTGSEHMMGSAVAWEVRIPWGTAFRLVSGHCQRHGQDRPFSVSTCHALTLPMYTAGQAAVRSPPGNCADSRSQPPRSLCASLSLSLSVSVCPSLCLRLSVYMALYCSGNGEPPRQR